MKKIKKYLFIIIIFIVLLSMIFAVKKVQTVNEEIERDISVEYIADENLKNGILQQKDKIKKQETGKIVMGEIIVLFVSLASVGFIEKMSK